MRLAGTFELINFFLKLVLCSFLYASANVAMAEYYQIEDTGPTYSDFDKKPLRVKYMDKLWGKVLPPAIKEKALSNSDSPYYQPTKGDVGILVAELGTKERKLILDVDGNLVLIGKSGVKAVSQQTYQDFLSNSSINASEVFGFKLGRTTYQEAISVLEQNGAKFDADLYYKGYTDIHVIRIIDYKSLPVINERRPSQSYLQFVDDRLFQISVVWVRTNNHPMEVDAFKDLSNSIYEALRSKYKRECRSAEDDSNVCHYWLNQQRHLTETTYSDNAYNVTKVAIEYNDSSLLDQANKAKEKIDNIIAEKERAKEDKKIENVGKQL